MEAAYCTAVCVWRPDRTDKAPDESTCDLTMDLFNSVELVLQPSAPGDKQVTVSAEDGAVLSAEDAVRFSSSVFTVSPLTYRD